MTGTATTTPKLVGSLDDLEKAAKETAEQLGKVTSHYAIWDKAAKSLKQGLADLAKARAEAQAEAGLADELLANLKGSYDSEASKFIRKKRDEVDAQIDGLKQAIGKVEEALVKSRTELAEAEKKLAASTATFEGCQKKLVNLPKDIQAEQKQVAGLRTEVNEADTKHQVVETVVKLADLGKALDGLKSVGKPEYEAELWKALGAAVADLIARTDALAAAKAAVAPLETKLNEARQVYADAQKNRLDTIRKLIADAEGTAKSSR